VSDGLDIRHGAVVSVDTESLRGAAGELEGLRARLGDAALLARAAEALLDEAAAGGAGPDASVAASRAEGLAAALERAGDDAHGLGVRLRRAAVVYEYVELVAARDAAVDPGLRAAYDARIAELLAHDPGIDLAAIGPRLGHDLRAPWELMRQAGVVGTLLAPGMGLALPAVVWAVGNAVRTGGQGAVPSASRLTGSRAPVVVTRVDHRAGTPVGSLAQAAARIPREAGIRVERYAMPDGGRRFVVYIAGTRLGTAFDMDSNVDLYGRGRTSPAYEAVRQALERSGARPGDVVHEVGHSQGGMVAGRIALEGEFDVRTLVTLGSPVQAQVPDTVLSVEVRHSDDIVSALADGGSVAGVGSAESFVAERTAHPAVTIEDVILPAHHLAAYTETAAMLDASPDPRMGAVRAVFAELGEATSVDVAEYSATRPEPEPAPSPGLSPSAAGAAGAG